MVQDVFVRAQIQIQNTFLLGLARFITGRAGSALGPDIQDMCGGRWTGSGHRAALHTFSFFPLVKAMHDNWFLLCLSGSKTHLFLEVGDPD